MEALARCPARAGLGLEQGFGDDTLAYFDERLDLQPTRRALASLAQQAKNNKAFDRSAFIGLAVDGSGAGFFRESGCPLCHVVRHSEHGLIGHRHKLCMVAIVGTPIPLPVDIEPHRPGEGEANASLRLLQRSVRTLGRRFADYVVADAEYARAPFLHGVGDLGLHSVVRLKQNLPELYEAAQQRFSQIPPSSVFEEHNQRIELWDAGDFDPWESLRWPTVRVLRYRQHKPDGTVVEAYWLTDLPITRASSRALYRMAKSRWEIENEGFNEAKTHHWLEHVPHHQENAVIAHWLLLLLALALERLYRLRWLHRGYHPVMTSIELLRALRFSVAARWLDTS
jgi:hypothetical protein